MAQLSKSGDIGLVFEV